MEQPHHRRQIFPFYDRTGVDLFSGLSTLTPLLPPPPSPPPLAAISPTPNEEFAFRQGDASWTSFPFGEFVQLGANVCRRSGRSGGTGAGGDSGGVVATGTTARCQAEGCSEDLNRAKHYHRKHKVCEFHSRAAAVVVHGLSRRFCQQCSRFHVLSEFDQGKRSCRKRLAEHNRRRRKIKSPPSPRPQPHRGTAVVAVPS
ncbi:unnamed protein product [Spirodela intermedia]|uniref:SBP-type domain-containing protein n=1 Tax=Spirodela intermedia TaxID=51605 RepID=A0A7I8K3H9_SPIIN|nr:unnamed protein product [Spirodela intermedia]